MPRGRWILAVLATAATAALTLQAGAPAAPSRSGGPVTVATGATKLARWELVMRSSRAGRRCLGIRVQQLWNDSVTARRETCGPHRLSRRDVTLGTLAPAGMGSFVFGRAGRSVGEVEVRVGDRTPMTVATIAAPGGRAWVAHAGLTCAEVEVHALDRRTGSAGKRRAGRLGPPGCG